MIPSLRCKSVRRRVDEAMFPYSWIQDARGRIEAHISPTPLTFDPHLQVYLKWENHQVTGSFKIRGALNKVLALEPWERQGGLVAASAGNHGQGVALAASLSGAVVTVFASQNAVPSKIEAMRRLGAQVELVPGGYGDAERAGLAYSAGHHATWISPYNDGQVIAGQATLGVEILEALPPLSSCAWIVPAGGGGLVSGIGASIRAGPAHQGVRRRLVAVQSEASPFLHAIFHHGAQDGVIELPSLADGLSGPVQQDSLTIPLVKNFVDDFILVSEDEIEQAVAFAWHRYQERIEGSAAAALAALISGKISHRPAVVVISGGNIQPEVHAEIIARHLDVKTQA